MRQDVVIWDSECNFDDWKTDLQYEYPDMNESELRELMYEVNNEYLEDERLNLDIPLDDTIIVIADLGRWDGRVSGYKELPANVSACLYSNCESARFYVDAKGDMRCDEAHHDGVNHLLFRMWNPNMTETQKDNFRDKILSGVVTPKDISRYTKSIGNKVLERYGIEPPKNKNIERE